MNLEFIDPAVLRRSFDKIADAYDEHAALEQEVGSRLLERIAFNRIPLHTIIDLGCGTGRISELLKSNFRKAQVIGLDVSPRMLLHLQRRSRLLRPLRAVCGELSALPLANGCVDLLFSNLAMHWCSDLPGVFAEFRRVLRPGGMLLFSIPGPDTLKELRQLCRSIGSAMSPGALPDLLEVGDALSAAGFEEPVMDAEWITLTYPDYDSLTKELEATGTAGLIPGWPGVDGEQQRLASAYREFVNGERFPVTCEIIFGTAFGPPEGQPRKTPQGDVATFSVDSLRRSGSGGRSP